MYGKLLLASVVVSAFHTQALAQDAGNPVRGKTLFLQCGACHSTAPGAAHKVGPNLSGIVGAPASSRTGYKYSEAFKNARLTWDEKTLSAFIEKPSAVVPGNKMVFGGIADPTRRRDIVAYLKTLK